MSDAFKEAMENTTDFSTALGKFVLQRSERQHQYALDRERIEFIRRAYLARLASGKYLDAELRMLAEQDWEAVREL